MNNQLSDIGVGNLNFHPMPKRFMVWDKISKQFRGDGKIFSWQEIACMLCPSPLDSEEEVQEREQRCELVQSTNLFAKDGKEIFEGSIVRDFDDAIGVVYYDLEDGEYRAKSTNGDSFELAESSCDLKVLGHILSNPELLEDEDNHARDKTVEEGVIMSNFTARTRLRGEVTYHKANWIDNYYDHGAYGVKFLEGPHEGEIHPPKDCAIAKDDAYLLRREK